MVKVYSFRVWDQAAGDYKVQPRKSIAERIAQIGGEIIDGTAEDVSHADLDPDGRYIPHTSRGGGFGAGAFGEGAFGEDVFETGALGRAPIGRAPIGRSRAGRSSGPASGGPLSGGALAEGALGEEERFDRERTFNDDSDNNAVQPGTADQFTEDNQSDPALRPSGPRAQANANYDQPSQVGLDAARINAERRRRNVAAVGGASVGAGAPPPPAETVLISNPQTIADREKPSGGLRPTAARIASAQSAIQANPSEFEAIAVDLAEQFNKRAEKLRGKNDRSSDEDELLEFLNTAGFQLRQLAQSIKSMIAAAQEDQPIFLGRAGKIAGELEQGFFEALRKHRAHVWEIGALGVGVVFLSQLGLSPSEVFGYLRGIFSKK